MDRKKSATSEPLMQKMRRIRKERKLTLFDLSMRMQVPEAVISRLEKGTLPPTKQQADIVRAFLGGKL